MFCIVVVVFCPPSPPLLQVFCFVVYKFVSMRKMINTFPIINIHEHILKKYVIEKPSTCSELTSAVSMSLHSLITFNSKLVKKINTDEVN